MSTTALDRRFLVNATLLEPHQFIEHFLAHPPDDFVAILTCDAVPAFTAKFDLLTTADAPTRRVVQALPGFSWWRRWLRPRTLFVGTTVSEYVVLPAHLRPEVFADCLVQCQGRRYPFVIVKDLPQASPLLPERHNALARELARALQTVGFVLMEGQALAYVPIDFQDIDEYLSRLSSRRRKDIRRKLRTRDRLNVERLATGSTVFDDPAVIDRFYSMYINVFNQSEIQFDRLSRDFFKAVLSDASNGGRLFLYWLDDELIGYNLCFVHERTLVDKYVGFLYPQAREANLYFVSWIQNLEYALEHGYTTYVAGWTDPEIKAYLGARFTMTQHAVYVRNRFLRFILRHVTRHFESDRAWQEAAHVAHHS